MYCPKCMIEIQGNGEKACPYCTTPLAESPLLQESQESAFFLEDEIDDTGDEQTGIETDNATFDSIISNTSGDIHQNNTQKLLDQAFEEIDTADEPAPTPSSKSLAITVFLGAALLACVIGTGIYYLNHIPANQAVMQRPEKTLLLPPPNAPAPTLKSSRSAQQQNEAVQAPALPDNLTELQATPADMTPAAVAQQKNPPPPVEVAALQANSQALPEQIQVQPQQKKEALTGGNDTQQSSTATSTINSMSYSATGSHILLCGSFQDKNKALNLAKKLKAKGYPAFVEKADIELKGVWYRIKIPGFSSKNAAEKARDDLKGKLKLEAVVTKQK